MKERPILFSGAMVRAILDGRKMQTRRIVKPSAYVVDVDWVRATRSGLQVDGSKRLVFGGRGKDGILRCPYGQSGDLLWLREKWAYVPTTAYRASEGVYYKTNPSDPDMCAVYAADWTRTAPPWKPSIHMPRWASRITLEVTGVRVERLQDISEDDSIAEGINFPRYDGNPDYPHDLAPSDVFRDLWDTINGKRAQWDSNPFCWVVEFRRIKP